MMMDDNEDYDYGESEDEFGEAIREAFPGEEWDEDRLAALKEAIRICVENDQEDKPPPKGSLALLFGPGPKKRR